MTGTHGIKGIGLAGGWATRLHPGNPPEK